MTDITDKPLTQKDALVLIGRLIERRCWEPHASILLTDMTDVVAVEFGTDPEEIHRLAADLPGHWYMAGYGIEMGDGDVTICALPENVEAAVQLHETGVVDMELFPLTLDGLAGAFDWIADEEREAPTVRH